MSSARSLEATVVAPTGRLDAVSAPSLHAQLQEMTESGSKRIVVDLAAVSFIDSTGLFAIIQGVRLARAAGGNLRIARPQAAIMLAINISNLEQVLRPYATVEAAGADL
jgi:anti-anti-sigma factor